MCGSSILPGAAQRKLPLPGKTLRGVRPPGAVEYRRIPACSPQFWVLSGYRVGTTHGNCSRSQRHRRRNFTLSLGITTLTSRSGASTGTGSITIDRSSVQIDQGAEAVWVTSPRSYVPCSAPVRSGPVRSGPVRRVIMRYPTDGRTSHSSPVVRRDTARCGPRLSLGDRLSASATFGWRRERYLSLWA